MKKFILLLTLALCLSCKEQMEGGWDPIKVDKSEVVFPSSGGEETVTVLNYEGWWILYGYEDRQKIDGVWQYINQVRSATSEGADPYSYDILEGGWYHAHIPNKGVSKQLVIAVDKNETGKSRQAIIEMECGDAFGNIKILQK